MIVERMLRIALLGSAWVMYLLLALSVVSVGAMLERWLFFRRHHDDIDSLGRRMHAALAADDLFEAESVLARSPSLEAGVLLKALRWIEGGPDVVVDVVASEVEAVRARLERGMNLLGTLGNNAPFVGLLGTVIGVIEAFNHLGSGQDKAAMGNVMSGIAEALVATGVGLFVAIPAVVAYNVAQKKVADIESNVARLTRLLTAVIRFRERGHSYADHAAGAHVPGPSSAPSGAAPRSLASEAERPAADGVAHAMDPAS